MADYEPIAQYIPRITDWRDLPDTTTPVMAEDIEAWQDRLAALTAKVNEAGARANTSGAGGAILGEPAAKGTLYVHDGETVRKLPPGRRGQFLTADSNAELGQSWVEIAGAVVAVGPSHIVAPTQSSADAPELFVTASGDVYAKATVDVVVTSVPLAIGTDRYPFQVLTLPPALRPRTARTIPSASIGDLAIPNRTAGANPRHANLSINIATDGKMVVEYLTGTSANFNLQTLQLRAGYPLYNIYA